MARSNFGPEVRAAMAEKSKTRGVPPKRPPPDTRAEAKAEGDTPAEMARDAKRGIVEGSPRDESMDAAAMPQMPGGMSRPSGQIGASHPPTPASVAQHSSVSQPNPAHAAIAASIAHAILGKGGM